MNPKLKALLPHMRPLSEAEVAELEDRLRAAGAGRGVDALAEELAGELAEMALRAQSGQR